MGSCQSRGSRQRRLCRAWLPLRTVSTQGPWAGPGPLHSTPSPVKSGGQGAVPPGPLGISWQCAFVRAQGLRAKEREGQATWAQFWLCPHCLTLRWTRRLSVPQFPLLTMRVMIMPPAAQGCSYNKRVDAHNTFREILAHAEC